MRRDSVRPERPSHIAAKPWNTRVPQPPREPAPMRLTVAAVFTLAAPRHFAQVAAHDASRARRRMHQAAETFALLKIVSDRASNVKPQPVPAAERHALLRLRVAAREAAAAAAPLSSPSCLGTGRIVRVGPFAFYFLG